LSYAQLMLGRFDESRATVREMQTTAAKTGDARSMEYVDEMIARHVVEASDWDLAAPLAREAADTDDRTQALLVLGFAAAHSGDAAGASGYAERLAAVRASVEASGQSYRAAGVGIAEHEVRAVAAMAGGDAEAALAQAELAVALERRRDPPSGPPIPIKPSGELYAELLLEAGLLPEAEAQFRAALDYIPSRSPARLGLARAVARQGRTAQAKRLYAELLEVWSGSDAELDALTAVASADGGD
jgi:tetratricopeptide (TPR) repeat protein